MPPETLKRLHEQFLVKAQQATYGQRIEQRYVTTAVLPIPRKKIKDVFAKLDKIRSDLSDEIHNLANKDTVYCLTLQYMKTIGTALVGIIFGLNIATRAGADVFAECRKVKISNRSRNAKGVIGPVLYFGATWRHSQRSFLRNFEVVNTQTRQFLIW